MYLWHRGNKKGAVVFQEKSSATRNGINCLTMVLHCIYIKLFMIAICVYSDSRRIL